MAKSKRKKRKSETMAFYEAMPTMAPTPIGLPQVSTDLRELSRRALAGVGSLRGPLRTAALSTYHQLRLSGLATTATLVQGYERARIATYYGAEAIITYTPPLTGDIVTYGGLLRRRLMSRRARTIYLLIIGGAVSAAVIGAAVITAETLKTYSGDIASPAALLSKKKTGTTILDRSGQVLYQGYGAQSTATIAIGSLPTSLKDATLAAEDPGFYDHSGFSLRGTARAALDDITHQSAAQGGSTITQQLVKNALLTTNKNFDRKFKELILATELENHYSKDEILQMYLNETYYGEGSSGVESASQTYFHKSAHDLTLGEAALLAGLPLGPSRFDPNFDLGAATGRRDYVLSRMEDLGKITAAQAKAAKAQKIVLAGGSDASTPDAMPIYAKSIVIQAPHFVFYVLDELRQLYGNDVIENGGITVRTTLDLGKQNLAQQTVTTQINKLADHHVTNGALISLDPKDGDILAMVGSTDYNAPGFGNVNVTLSDLQPGSSFKPIAYATAFEKGWNGATSILDAPFSSPSGDGTMYTPQNYDLKFHGNVTVRHALDNSLNIPAVKTLQFAGIPDTIQTAHNMGITTLNDPSRYGLSLVLGGGEVRPIDMATVYATFANNGVKVEPRSILKVTDRNGADITKATQPAPKAELDPRVAYMITNILSDDHARQPEFPANGPLTLAGRPAAAKTGTTNDFRDNWTVGYTPQLVTAVWVGNNDHTAMNNVDGITGAAPIWHDYMTGALADQPAQDFTVPTGVTAAQVCTDGGLLNPWDTGGTTEIFETSNLPTKHCGTFAPVASPAAAPQTTAQVPAGTTPSPTPYVLPTPTKPGRFNPFGN